MKQQAGYSGTPLPSKLGVKDGHHVALLGAPAGFALDAPQAVHHAKLPREPKLDVIVAFVTTRAQLVQQIAACRPHMQDAAGLWIAWPKKSSGVATDIVEQTIRDVALPTGLVDNKVCAIDETWSGLRLVIRRELRTSAPAARSPRTPKPAAVRSRPAPRARRRAGTK
jgi:hypothetical protein